MTNVAPTIEIAQAGKDLSIIFGTAVIPIDDIEFFALPLVKTGNPNVIEVLARSGETYTHTAAGVIDQFLAAHELID